MALELASLAPQGQGPEQEGSWRMLVRAAWSLGWSSNMGGDSRPEGGGWGENAHGVWERLPLTKGHWV